MEQQHGREKEKDIFSQLTNTVSVKCKVWGQEDFFLKGINTFIQQGCIKFINIDSIFDIFETSINQRKQMLLEQIILE